MAFSQLPTAKRASKIFLQMTSAVVVSLLGAQLVSPSAIAQSSPYRLTTQFTGENKCLDIVNDGTNNKLIMADCGNYSGQMWSIEPTRTLGAYRMRTQFTGDDKCLDIVNDGTNNQVIMADCGNYSGQFWSIQPTNNSGAYRLRTQFTGEEKCLDIVNDGTNNQLVMADCGNYSGQYWTIR